MISMGATFGVARERLIERSVENRQKITMHEQRATEIIYRIVKGIETSGDWRQLAYHAERREYYASDDREVVVELIGLDGAFRADETHAKGVKSFAG